MTPPYLVREIGPDELPAFCAVMNEAFNGGESPGLSVEREMLTFEFDRSAAAFDGKLPVGTSAAYTFRLSVPGGMAATAGISDVAVLPTYRRRGIMSRLIRHHLAEAGRRGEPLAALFASEAGIYQRFGFGSAAREMRFSIRRGEGALTVPPALTGPPAPAVPPTAPAPPAPAGLAGPPAPPSPAPPSPRSAVSAPPSLAPAVPAPPRLRLAAPAEAAPQLAAVYAAATAVRPGAFARDDRWWRGRLWDPEPRRGGASPLRCVIAEDDAGPRGYALYSAKAHWAGELPDSEITVRELYARDAPAAAALWSDLLSRDLVSVVVATSAPVDDPLLSLLADPRRARPSVGDNLWVRLVDLPAALAGRAYACDIDTVIEVTDPEIAANAGRWHLTAPAGEAGGARCERTAAEPDLITSVAALGAAYLGGTRLGQLAAAGHIAPARPAALSRLSAAMSWDPAPWCSMIF